MFNKLLPTHDHVVSNLLSNLDDVSKILNMRAIVYEKKMYTCSIFQKIKRVAELASALTFASTSVAPLHQGARREDLTVDQRQLNVPYVIGHAEDCDWSVPQSSCAAVAAVRSGGSHQTKPKSEEEKRDRLRNVSRE
ncbi:hypothetical protein F2P81_002083 [Scophthalmus maximus]|uniref:Uncharacterized protein n=1 Tax=Scophthalmus maximus TaxID=52904 RepID=A0A6A4TQP6_SCOMX|nr:hypothetical protein F2P81_002083 [Scophthalmus maximus]